MLTTMTKMVMTAVFGLTMFAAGDAEAARERGPRHEDRGAKMCERLDCTAAQKAQLTQLRAAHKPAMQAERQAIRDLKQQLVAEYRKDPFDAARVKSLREQLEARKTAARGQREATKAEIDAILTPAQRAKLAELRAQHKGQRGKGHRRGRGHHKGHAHRG